MIVSIPFQIRVVAALPDSTCSVSPTLLDLSGREVDVSTPGVYTVYRDRRNGQVEVQAHFRSVKQGGGGGSSSKVVVF